MYKMQCIAIFLFLSVSVSIPSCANARSITCGEFDALSGVSTHEDFKHSHWTTAQFEAFRAVIAQHVGDIATFHRFSKRNDGVKAMLKNKQALSFIMSNALSMTIDFCVDRKSDPMSDVAIEQFDYLLDAFASGLKK